MVKDKEEHFGISWGEDMGPEDIHRVTDSIVSAITDSFKAPTAGYHRLYFVVPTPVPYAKAEAKLFSAFYASKKMTGELRAVALPRKGKCYVISGEKCFRKLLPLVFDLGPPELTFIAANCTFDICAEEDVIVRFVFRTVKGEFPADCDIKGLHFDSGDLIESF